MLNRNTLFCVARRSVFPRVIRISNGSGATYRTVHWKVRGTTSTLASSSQAVLYYGVIVNMCIGRWAKTQRGGVGRSVWQHDVAASDRRQVWAAACTHSIHNNFRRKSIKKHPRKTGAFRDRICGKVPREMKNIFPTVPGRSIFATSP